MKFETDWSNSSQCAKYSMFRYTLFECSILIYKSVNGWSVSSSLSSFSPQILCRHLKFTIRNVSPLRKVSTFKAHQNAIYPLLPAFFLYSIPLYNWSVSNQSQRSCFASTHNPIYNTSRSHHVKLQKDKTWGHQYFCLTRNHVPSPCTMWTYFGLTATCSRTETLPPPFLYHLNELRKIFHQTPSYKVFPSSMHQVFDRQFFLLFAQWITSSFYLLPITTWRS